MQNMVSKAMLDKVWSEAKVIKGKSPDTHRTDPYGNVIYKSSYGKLTAMGWEVDHINPKSKGGSDCLVNLQALSSKVNRLKSNSLIKKSRHSKANK